MLGILSNIMSRSRQKRSLEPLQKARKEEQRLTLWKPLGRQQASRDLPYLAAEGAPFREKYFSIIELRFGVACSPMK